MSTKTNLKTQAYKKAESRSLVGNLVRKPREGLELKFLVGKCLSE